MMPSPVSTSTTETDRTEHSIAVADQPHEDTKLLGVALIQNAHSINDSVKTGFALRTSVVIALLLTPPSLWMVFNIEQLVELSVQWRQ